MITLDRLERLSHWVISRWPLAYDASRYAYQALLFLVPALEKSSDVPILHRRHAFFGFHDKCPWSPDGTYVLCHDIAHQRDNRLAITVLDGRGLEGGPIGTTATWNWQQGATLQWLPGRQVLTFHDVERSTPITRLMTVTGDALAALPGHVAHFDPLGRFGVTICFGRLGHAQPGYGYPRLLWSRCSGDHNEGLGLLHLDSGIPELRVSLHQLLSQSGCPPSAFHYLCQPLPSPDGRLIAFFHRHVNAAHMITTHPYVYDVANDRLTPLCLRDASHMCWMNPTELVVTGRSGIDWGYFLFSEPFDGSRLLLPDHLRRDGHPQASPDGSHLISDTYPNRRRLQSLLLIDLQVGTVRVLLEHRIPLRFSGFNRCDFHPRWSPGGQRVAFDSAHTGSRSLYVIDVSGINGPDKATL